MAQAPVRVQGAMILYCFRLCSAFHASRYRFVFCCEFCFSLRVAQTLAELKWPWFCIAFVCVSLLVTLCILKILFRVDGGRPTPHPNLSGYGLYCSKLRWAFAQANAHICTSCVCCSRFFFFFIFSFFLCWRLGGP